MYVRNVGETAGASFSKVNSFLLWHAFLEARDHWVKLQIPAVIRAGAASMGLECRIIVPR